MRNLIGWVWVAIVSVTRPTRAVSVYHQTGYAIDEAWEVGDAPQGIAGAESESLSGAQGTTGGSGDFNGS